MRIAVIGAGIAGLSAAWLLRNHHQVTLFEAEHRAGGHSNTVDIEVEGQHLAVDTGFLVHNDRTYPNLIALFDLLGVKTYPSEMSFSVRVEASGLEWAGTNLNTLFAQRSNLVSPSFWRMLRDILRLHQQAPQLLEQARQQQWTLGQLLQNSGFSREMQENYLLPMGAAIWSAPVAKMRQFPAASFLSFCQNHGLLQVSDRPQWKTVVGGSRVYVEKVITQLTDKKIKKPIERVIRNDKEVLLFHSEGRETFDQVIFACHTDQILLLLANPSEAEQNILSAISYQKNYAVLHADESFLPKQKRAWAAWNYSAMSAQHENEQDAVMVTYLLNRLQPLTVNTPIMVSLNPYKTPKHIFAEFHYAHPVFTTEAIAAQKHLHTIQGQQRSWFCGAWAGYGFHEDGLKAGMAVAQSLGATVPWRHQVPPAHTGCIIND